MKMYKFITIEWRENEGAYYIKNNKTDDVLGIIMYYKAWKQYVFVADENAIWSADCLRDIINFIEKEIPK